jgi:hypothetical protein
MQISLRHNLGDRESACPHSWLSSPHSISDHGTDIGVLHRLSRVTAREGKDLIYATVQAIDLTDRGGGVSLHCWLV